MIDPLVRLASVALGLPLSAEVVCVKDDPIEWPAIERPLAMALAALLLRTKAQQVRISAEEWALVSAGGARIGIKRDAKTGDIIVRMVR